MRIHRIVISAAFASGIAALPLSTAQAQYYYAPCSPFPLTWPFCVAGAAVATATTIATAPFWLLSGTPPYYAPPYYPAPFAPAYYPLSVTYAPPPAVAPEAAPSAAPLPPPPPSAHPPVSQGPPPGRDAYYFCPASKAFYPYVASCAVAWRSVPITPPPRSAPH